MENFNFSTLDMGQFAPGGLFETFEAPLDHQNKLGGNFFDNILEETSTINNNQWIEDIQLSSDSMASLLELQEIKEVKSEPVSIRTSVIKSPIKKKKSNPADLGNILLNCGIEDIGMYDTTTISYEPVASPSNSSEVSEMEQNQELIDELEEFFIKTEGSPTNIEETLVESVKPQPPTTPTPINHESILKALSSGNVLNTEEMITEDDLNNAYTTSVTTEDGQNVIIIIAPNNPKEAQSPAQSPIHVSSPSPSNSSDYESSYETDPEWAPSPISTIQNGAYPTSEIMQSKAPRKKYARSKPLTPPTGPYPTDKKERKKAQNRTAAFRYREKKKSEQDDVELEMEKLAERNVVLREKLTEMETEFKYLKKLMIEAGLGKYAAAVQL